MVTQQSKKLLVVDDETDICELVSDIAELEGYSAQSVAIPCQSDLLSGLEEFDVLVLDLCMPELDGIEIIYQMEKLQKKPALIIMSGVVPQVLDNVGKLASRLGIPLLGVLPKPFRFSELKYLLNLDVAEVPAVYPSRKKSFRDVFSISEIKEGLKRKEFIPYYQPQIDLKTGKVFGVEALVRWLHRDKVITPDHFLPEIENNSLIKPLTETVIEQTLEQALNWQESGNPDLRVSINLSAAYLNQLDLISMMDRLLKIYPIAPEKITFELIERIALDSGSQLCLDTIIRLRLRGFNLSLDDFGTGYSSLSQLNHLPFNEIKIDQHFVSTALSSPQSEAIVKSSVSLARQLGVRCIAEGVETKETEAFLLEQGCDNAQGFLYSQSLPGVGVVDWANGFRYEKNIEIPLSWCS